MIKKYAGFLAKTAVCASVMLGALLAAPSVPALDKVLGTVEIKAAITYSVENKTLTITYTSSDDPNDTSVIPNNFTPTGNSGEINTVIIGNGITGIADGESESEGAFSAQRQPGGYQFKITSVSLPGTLTSIGKYAFFENQNIETLVIPYSVTKIENNAFGKVQKLNNLTIVVNPDITIDENAFKDAADNDLTFNTLKKTVTINTAKGQKNSTLTTDTPEHSDSDHIWQWDAESSSYICGFGGEAAPKIAESYKSFGDGYYCVDVVNGNTYIIVKCSAEQAATNKEINIKSGDTVVNVSPIDTVYRTIRFNDTSELTSTSLGVDYIAAIKIKDTNGAEPNGTLIVEYVPIES